MKLRYQLFVASGLSLLAGSAGAATLASVDFNNGGELASSFRPMANPTFGTPVASPVYTQPGGAANFAQGTSASTIFYDENGSTAGVTSYAVTQATPITVSTTVVLNANNGSFGIYFINAANENQGYMALFNVNYTTGSPIDQFRFDNLGSPTTGNVNTTALAANATTADAGVTSGTAFNMSATYTILSATSYQLSMTVGSYTSSATYTGTPISNVEIGFRTNPIANNTGSFDNLLISQVPEPSAAILGAMSSALLVFRRRR